MTAFDRTTVEPAGMSTQPPAAPAAYVELDRFCEGCGYNLRTLPVYRDERTEIPVVRCPECGRFQPANDTTTALRPMLHRVTSVLLVVWMLTIIAAFIHLAVAEGALSYATLDELTIHGGYQSRRITNTTTYTWSGSQGPLQVNRDYADYELFVTMIMTVSFLVAFGVGLFTVVVVPHWRRRAYAGLVLALPVVAGALVALIWSKEAPHLFGWGLLYVTSHTGMQMLGGLAGIMFGRPLARVAVRVFLPPGVRPKLAFLWLADGKPLPAP